MTGLWRLLDAARLSDFCELQCSVCFVCLCVRIDELRSTSAVQLCGHGLKTLAVWVNNLELTKFLCLSWDAYRWTTKSSAYTVDCLQT